MKRVSPEEAKALMDEGYAYVDVRSIPEFEQGHPEGAYNVPLAHLGPRGMAPNPDFLAVLERHFSRDSTLVIGCQSGSRSLHAASMLERAGYVTVVDQRAGFGGTGAEAGWRALGLPSTTRAAPGRSYEELTRE
jgi:rhodanese-related sulfurtransferase